MFLQGRLGADQKSWGKSWNGRFENFLPIRKAPEEKWGKAEKFSLECSVHWDIESISGLMTAYWENTHMKISHLAMLNFILYYNNNWMANQNSTSIKHRNIPIFSEL